MVRPRLGVSRVRTHAQRRGRVGALPLDIDYNRHKQQQKLQIYTIICGLSQSLAESNPRAIRDTEGTPNGVPLMA